MKHSKKKFNVDAEQGKQQDTQTSADAQARAAKAVDESKPDADAQTAPHPEVPPIEK